jgi:beta-fructofuranosidase
MSLDRFVQQCGGAENIRRVLIPDTRLIVEVANPDLVEATVKQQRFNNTMSQVTFEKGQGVTSEMLAEADLLIEKNLRARCEDFVVPVSCKHRPQWHISPPRGLLNDPNGFIFHNGEYHMFYQWYPFGCEHKDKFWAHLTSKDLINWLWQPIALTPSAWFDSHGVFSGHALSNGDELMLFYTGNTRIDEQRDRHTTQCLATCRDGVNFTKRGPVVFDLPPGVTPHCRDPKIVKHNDKWLMLLGVQTEALLGRLALYSSDDLYNWEFLSLCGDEFGDFGYMWECPDLFELNSQLFAVIGPQGINADSDHHTVPHHNGITKALLDDEGRVTLSEFEHLDYGFDFYAPQTALLEDGRRVICGWMGLPDEVDHPSIESGWLHQLTAMREISYVNGKLHQMPVKELQILRGEHRQLDLNDAAIDVGHKSFELDIELSWGSELELFKSKSSSLSIRLDKKARTLYLDRSNTLIREGDKVRELKLESDSVRLQIFADNSSVEIFINGGEQAMTARVFTPEDATSLALRGSTTLNLWTLNAAAAPFVGGSTDI